jgi:hypothetical protein
MARDKKLPPSKRDRERQKQQKKANKPLAVGRILIVCEGEKTEPNYFNWWKEKLENIKKAGKSRTVGRIDVVPDDGIEVKGEGKNTESLVRRAIQYRDQANIDYTQVWCVFDKDSFKPKQYNAAINKAHKENMKVAYTNEAFELWYLLHFDFVNTGVSREQYKEKLTILLGKKYKKNNPKMYEILLNLPNADQQKAIQRAKKLLKSYERERNYADQNPSTTVHELVEFLNDHVWQFRCQVYPTYSLPYPHDCKQCKEPAQPSPPYPCRRKINAEL